jgi:hypothetical protein
MVRVSISVEPDSIHQVVDAMRVAGYAIVQVLDELGIISAECPAEKMGQLSSIAGVRSVEQERSVSIPRPVSRIP